VLLLLPRSQQGREEKIEVKMKVEEIESQLHEQFAVNNNDHASTLVSIIAAVVAVIGAYGYVFVHSTVYGQKVWGKLVFDDRQYTLSTLLLTGSAAIFILAILAAIALTLGASARRDQFIVHAIRCKAYGGSDKLTVGNDGIFPSGYHPFEKGDDFCIGIFGTCLTMCHWLWLIVVLLTVSRIPFSRISEFFQSGPYLPPVLFLIMAVAYFILFLPFNCCLKLCLWHKECKKYDNLQKEFKDLKP